MLLDLGDVDDGDLPVLHRLQHDVPAGLVVVVEADLAAMHRGELDRLERVAHLGRVGAAGFFDCLRDHAHALVGAPGLQVRRGVVLRLDLGHELLVLRGVDLLAVGPGIDRAFHAAGGDDLRVEPAELDPAGEGYAHPELHGRAQEVDGVTAELDGGDGVRPPLLQAREDRGEIGCVLGVKIGRDDVDPDLCGGRLERVGRAASVVGVLAHDRHGLEDLLRAEIGDQRLHHVLVGRIDPERPVVAADARQRRDLRVGGDAGHHRYLAVLDNGHGGEVGRAAMGPDDGCDLGLHQLVGDIGALGGIALVVERQHLDLAAEQAAAAVDLFERELDAPALPFRRCGGDPGRGSRIPDHDALGFGLGASMADDQQAGHDAGSQSQEEGGWRKHGGPRTICLGGASR